MSQPKRRVAGWASCYGVVVPKLWTTTVETHRQEVRAAIVDAVGHLATEQGLLSLTMSQIAEAAGIGRATLYKYFADVEQVLTAWHDRQVAVHLAELTTLRDQQGTPATRLRSVLETYGRIARQRQHVGEQLAAALHRSNHVDHAEQQLHDLVAGLISEAAAAGTVRTDVPAPELAGYCIHALSAAGDAVTTAALDRLLGVIWAGLLISPTTGSTSSHDRDGAGELEQFPPVAIRSANMVRDTEQGQ